MGVAKRSETGSPGAAMVAAHSGDLAQLAPALAERLTLLTYEDGSARQTDTLLVFAQDGVWKAALRDRDSRLCLWAASPVLIDLVEVLEGLLCDPAAVWRADRAAGAAEASRQKPKK